MKTFVSNIQSVWGTDKVSDDTAGIVDELIMFAGLAIVAIVLVGWLGKALLNRGADVAQCVEGSNTYAGNEAQKACKDANHAKKNSFKKDSSYKSRY